MDGGGIGPAQMAWLTDQLQRCHRRWRDERGRWVEGPGTDRLVVLLSHHSSWTMTNAVADEADPGPRTLGPDLVALLDRFPNVVLWVNGHTHRHNVRAHRRTEGGGWRPATITDSSGTVHDEVALAGVLREKTTLDGITVIGSEITEPLVVGLGGTYPREIWRHRPQTARTRVLIPVHATACLTDTPANCFASVLADWNSYTVAEATLDGVPQALIEQPPVPGESEFTAAVPRDGILGLKPGLYHARIAAGRWAIVDLPEPGLYVLRVRAQSTSGTALDVTYRLSAAEVQ